MIKMPQKNIILSSLKESFLLIQKNKLLFIFLIISQIAFFAAFSLISLNYIPKMVESEKAIADYMGGQQLDEASVASRIMQKKGILGDDPLSISRNFNDIKGNFRAYTAYTFVLLIISGSIIWAMTSRMVYGKKFSSLTKIFLKKMAIMLCYLGLIFSFFFSLLDISAMDAAEESSKIFSKYIPLLVFSIALFYFMLVSLSLPQDTEFKNIVQQTLSIGIRKWHYLMAAYAVNLSLLSLSAFLFYYSIDKNLFLLFLSPIILVCSMMFGRVFLVSLVKRIKT